MKAVLWGQSCPISGANDFYCFLQTPKTPGLRPMEHKDIPAVHKLLTEYLKHFHLTPVMSREEVEHWFLPQENIIDTFVVEVSRRSEAGLFSWDHLGVSCCRALLPTQGLPQLSGSP